MSPLPYAVPPPPGNSSPSDASNRTMQNRIDTPVSAPAPPHAQDFSWSKVPLPSHFSSPGLASASRVSSYQSTISNLSAQSEPIVLSTNTLINTTSPGQYNPLHHYQPCMYPSCTSHYTLAHTGPTYYLPQGPYSLARLHGYCHQHATREWKETNAMCKSEWECLRQNAGRKTLGSIAAEFEIFLEGLKEERGLEDGTLFRKQKIRVSGVAQPVLQSHNSAKGKARQDEEGDSAWDWRYSPRPCITSSCLSPPYSPYANDLYAFYHTRQPSTFLPLRVLCPTCSKAEVEMFAERVTEKWSSRCGWDKTEWNGWFSNVVRDREMEGEFWEATQGRAVKARGPVQLVEKVEEEEEEGKKGKRSILRKLFSSMTV
ncbi:uncharacterized protein K460DRAFT_360732 [Cucurbitaria berberidis CBS 394.84]|uniref:Uncharacterized protein n=1 Tax=Cucurbitaria berberidis CBS 394.84 TaxID=1168544 RepID=A0A9P4GR90_9PLEO|nr:uncharacterized protein K460DRAFT_360732 [Cucurbitaria berberidis CBS 394.84]KAF1849882.1 hypothetical protein K460DRAFT_360732 [Cucurbitaria berberidis CBS 394.84]